MKLSLLLSSVAVASALPGGPHGKGPKGYPTEPAGNKSAVVPALYEGETKCTYPVADPRFKLEKYLGTWYQVAGTPFRETQGGKCVTAKYGLNVSCLSLFPFPSFIFEFW